MSTLKEYCQDCFRWLLCDKLVLCIFNSTFECLKNMIAISVNFQSCVDQ